MILIRYLRRYIAESGLDLHFVQDQSPTADVQITTRRLACHVVQPIHIICISICPWPDASLGVNGMTLGSFNYQNYLYPRCSKQHRLLVMLSIQQNNGIMMPRIVPFPPPIEVYTRDRT